MIERNSLIRTAKLNIIFIFLGNTQEINIIPLIVNTVGLEKFTSMKVRDFHEQTEIAKIFFVKFFQFYSRGMNFNTVHAHS